MLAISRAGLVAPMASQLVHAASSNDSMIGGQYGTANALDIKRLPEMAHATSFGARFDGVTDDSQSLQRAVDSAAERGQMLVLPGGTAMLSRPLNLRNRNLAIRGQIMNGSKLRASRKMDALIDAAADRDQIISPLILSDLTLDGNEMVERCLSIAYRHHSVLSNLYITGGRIGVFERATWLSRRSNCRVSNHLIGWRLAGENNSSHWQGCTFTNCSATHLDVGSSDNGNVALLFQNCDIEFGDGVGVRIGHNVEATFDSCYIGEGLAGDTLQNAGTVMLRSGAFFFGGRKGSCGLRSMPNGHTRLNGTQINGMQFGGLENLIAVDDPARPGSVAFADVKANVQIGGNPIVAGDVLGTAAIRNFVPRLGRDWVATAQQCGIDDGISLVDRNARTVTCRSTAGTNGLFGLAGQLVATDWREAEPLMILLAYSASRSVTVRLSHASHGGGPSMEIGTLPPSPGIATYIKIDVPAVRNDFRFLELFTDASPAAFLTLYRATLADNGFLCGGARAAFANLAHAQ